MSTEYLENTKKIRVDSCVSSIFLTLSPQLCLATAFLALSSPSLAGGISHSISAAGTLNVQVLENGAVRAPNVMTVTLRHADSSLVCKKIEEVTGYIEQVTEYSIRALEPFSFRVGKPGKGLCNFTKAIRLPSWKIVRVAFDIKHPDYSADSISRSKLKPNQEHVWNNLSVKCKHQKGKTINKRIFFSGYAWPHSSLRNSVSTTSGSLRFPNRFASVNIQCLGGSTNSSSRPAAKARIIRHVRFAKNSQTTVKRKEQLVVSAKKARIVYSNGRIVPDTGALLGKYSTKTGREVTLSAGYNSPAGSYSLQVFTNGKWTFIPTRELSISIINPKSGTGSAPRSNRGK